ncbi:unnamed protein product, partial [marine sediment metagenome]
MIRLIPGDAVDAVVARMREVGFSGDFAAGRAHFEQLLGLDVPVFTQYGRWLGVIPGADGSVSGIFQGDF